MESPRKDTDSLTKSQRKAVDVRGNVLVMAGAGTGKTRTLVARCLDCLDRERASLDELLVVTFTEAAAAEMRLRLRRELEKKSNAAPRDEHWPRQLALFDIANIGTLHGFCLRLVREHFYELGLDPKLTILDQGEARHLANETLDGQFQAHYAGTNEFSLAVQNLIQIYGGGRDEKIRQLVLRLHDYSQTQPDAAGWLAKQINYFSPNKSTDWEHWLLTAIRGWRDEWVPVLENLKSRNEKAIELAGIFQQFGKDFTREVATEFLEQIFSIDGKGKFPNGQFTKLREPLGDLFNEAAFLAALAPVKNGIDPLAEDWSWMHEQMTTLLRLAQEFAGQFSDRKRADGVLDFHDLEQFALRLLWDFSTGEPTAIAKNWRKKLRFVFVDEYQDINAAQDKIITALSRDGAEANRFLVGDAKQSIYRFRLADPKIFRDYARSWCGKDGQVIPLAENFRSHESLLDFANSVFSLLMHDELGGVAYDEDAKLKFGSPATRTNFRAATNESRRTVLLLRLKAGRGEAAAEGELADLADTDKEARLVALHLRKLVAERHQIWDEQKQVFREVEWRDVAVLLRAPAGKSEIFAKQFELAGVPLSVARGGFFKTLEILDLLSLLQLLDNPLQDVPCIAVLRSPLVGLSLDELAEIRLAVKNKHFWTALNWVHNEKIKIESRAAEKIATFLDRFERWRKLVKQGSLSKCLEVVLEETLYADWLRAQPRGAQRAANINRLLDLAHAFDQYQRQGLFRFLKYLEAQQEAEVEPEVSVVAAENAVRLMSIHQSKGLEFPVVVLPDLAKGFNQRDLQEDIIFDEEFGLCPKVKPPQTGRRYPGLTHWLAQRRQSRELRGEELRLLYVALTRARDTLILSASITEKKWETVWTQPEPVTPKRIVNANSFADWLGIWFSNQKPISDVPTPSHGELPQLRWRLVRDEDLAGVEKADCRNQEAEKELPLLDAATMARLRNVLGWDYPHKSATVQKAKSSVTELRRAVERLDEEAEPVFSRPRFSEGKRQMEGGKHKLNAAETGSAHHKFLQHFALENAGDFAAEAGRLVNENFLSADVRAVLDLDALAAFWNSPLGQKIRANAKSVRRELPFTARFSPAEILAITGAKAGEDLKNEFVVVQGVADLVVLLPEEIWLVDFKTDGVGKSELPEKFRTYTPQLRLYASALEKIFTRPVTGCWLHFLSLRHSEPVRKN